MSDHYVQLVAIDGTLYFPRGGFDNNMKPDPSAPSLLLHRYPSGDADTCPWPMQSPYATEAELRKRLASALYDERETNDEFPSGASDVLLPDGRMFSFEYELCL